jgi:hypothetical protein
MLLMNCYPRRSEGSEVRRKMQIHSAGVGRLDSEISQEVVFMLKCFR